MDPVIYMPVYSSISHAFIIQLMIFSTDMVLLEEMLHQAGRALSNLILECNWKFDAISFIYLRTVWLQETFLSHHTGRQQSYLHF